MQNKSLFDNNYSFFRVRGIQGFVIDKKRSARCEHIDSRGRSVWDISVSWLKNKIIFWVHLVFLATQMNIQECLALSLCTIYALHLHPCILYESKVIIHFAASSNLQAELGKKSDLMQ